MRKAGVMNGGKEGKVPHDTEVVALRELRSVYFSECR